MLIETLWPSSRAGTLPAAHRQPITSNQAATLTASLRRRLHLLGLTASERFGEPIRLTATGRAAAHTALRARALRPRQHPLG
jgi:hypothetical protein